tara:strand:+ start:174 stop:275 length:102 start_codon:yes stop_codon:yes gene_type:complete
MNEEDLIAKAEREYAEHQQKKRDDEANALKLEQ